MKQTDNNFVTMCRTLQNVLTQNAAVWDTQIAFSNQVNTFNSLMDNLARATEGAELVSSGATTDKATAELNAVKLAVNLAKRASIYALDVNNMELHDQLRVSKSTLLKRPDELTLAKLKDIVAMLSDVVGVLANYGVAFADIMALRTMTERYERLIVRPRTVVVERKGYNQDMIPGLLADLRMVLYKMDSLINLFPDSDLSRQYKDARIIVDLGSRREGEPGSAPEA